MHISPYCTLTVISVHGYGLPQSQYALFHETRVRRFSLPKTEMFQGRACPTQKVVREATISSCTLMMISRHNRVLRNGGLWPLSPAFHAERLLNLSILPERRGVVV